MNLNRFISIALLLAALYPSEAFACTPALDVDSEAFYRAIALPGQIASAVSVLAAIVWLVMSRKRDAARTFILIALAVLNPGWWMWDIGDCGTLAFLVGGAFALASLIALGTGFWSRRAIRDESVVPPGV